MNEEISKTIERIVEMDFIQNSSRVAIAYRHYNMPIAAIQL